MARIHKDYYEEINKALQSYENFKPWHDKSLDWISNRIEWCTKWKKITKEQTTELVDRICNIFENY